MLTVRCKQCGVEITSTHKTQVCGCPNRMEVVEDKVSAINLNDVVIVSNNIKQKKKSIFKPEDIAWQEKRRKRKIRKLDYDVR